MSIFGYRKQKRKPSHALQIITCDGELGACRRGPGLGPDAVLYELFTHELDDLLSVPIDHITSRALKPWELSGRSIDLLAPLAQASNDYAAQYLECSHRGLKQVLLSGDHSCAIGLFTGFREIYQRQRIGLIWIDAHGDIHTPFTSPSGNAHGMPLAALMGLDHTNELKELDEIHFTAWEALKRSGPSQILPKISAEDLYFFGIRDLEVDEWAAIERHGIYFARGGKDLTSRFETELAQLIAWSRQFDVLYVSFDVDGLEGELVPGTGTPVEDGLTFEQARQLLEVVISLPNFRVLEICEVNPLLDRRNSVASLVAKLLAELWEGLVDASPDELLMFDVARDAGFGFAQR